MLWGVHGNLPTQKLSGHVRRRARHMGSPYALCLNHNHDLEIQLDAIGENTSDNFELRGVKRKASKGSERMNANSTQPNACDKIDGGL